MPRSRLALEGVRKVISDDYAFLLGLAYAELAKTLPPRRGILNSL